MSTSSTPPADQASTAELVDRLTTQTKRLVQDEIGLAKLELAEKAKNAGVGVGLFGGGGLFALYGLGALVAAAILGIAEGLAPWLAALIVSLVLFVVAAAAALVGRSKVRRATPAAPEEAIASVKRDIAEVKEARRS